MLSPPSLWTLSRPFALLHQALNRSKAFITEALGTSGQPPPPSPSLRFSCCCCCSPFRRKLAPLCSVLFSPQPLLGLPTLPRGTSTRLQNFPTQRGESTPFHGQGGGKQVARNDDDNNSAAGCSEPVSFGKTSRSSVFQFSTFNDDATRTQCCARTTFRTADSAKNLVAPEPATRAPVRRSLVEPPAAAPLFTPRAGVARVPSFFFPFFFAGSQNNSHYPQRQTHHQ